MVSYLFRMPAGVPGDINRAFASIIEPASITPYGTAGAPSAYGIPLVADTTAGNVGNMRSMFAADYSSETALASGVYIYGLLARTFPTTDFSLPSTTGDLGVSVPPTSGVCDVARMGYMSVLLSGTTAAVKGQPVFVWLAASSGTHILGGWEAQESAGNTYLIPGAFFTGPADANGFTEISFNFM